MFVSVQRWAGKLTLKHLALALSINILIVAALARTPIAAALPPGVNFNAVIVGGVDLSNPTTLDFGPDGRLYVAQQNGFIYALTVERTDVDSNGTGEYTVTGTETIGLIRNIQNHNDDGTLHSVIKRQITGLAAAGTAANPQLYVSSSDYREGGGGSGGDLGLDTNSGVVSRLTWNGVAWEKLDLVRGLPRSEENHSTNGMWLDAAANVLYVASSGSTNAGSPSNNFAYTTEYALATAILTVDLNVVNALPTQGAAPNLYKYDLPTLDDPTRPGNPDNNDPFGGNDGMNQAKLVPGGPVQIFSSGFRNVYDVIKHSNGLFYAVDNGANQGWGGHPAGEGTANCTNEYLVGEPGSTGPGPGGDPKVNNLNGLHAITAGYYAGHPNPIRGNPSGAGLYYHDGTSGTWITATALLPVDWPPVPPAMAHSIECDFQQAGVDDGALLTYSPSTNGITEYTAGNFNGALQGAIISAGYDGKLFIALPAPDGLSVTNGVETFASGFGYLPLDVIAQGDSDPFPGTVWAVAYGETFTNNDLIVFEPDDIFSCSGEYLPAADEDGDGFTNADEIDNGASPCNASDRPEDFDGTLIGGFLVSNLNDPDDDDDGVADLADPFPWDATNGAATNLPLQYTLFNDEPGTGMYGLGFTGLMGNGVTDYLAQRDPFGDGIFGGTAGQLTLPTISAGTARGAANSQVNAFQFGLDTTSACAPFTIETKINGPFDGLAPQVGQVIGAFIGSGDQDNYLMLAAAADNGTGAATGGVELYFEVGGVSQPASAIVPAPAVLGAVEVLLSFEIDPAAGTVRAYYQITDAGNKTALGQALVLPAGWLSPNALAVGIISTSGGAADLSATWDYIHADYSAAGSCDVPLAGLTLTSNSPVTLGMTSMYTATLDQGNNVQYRWNLYDGTVIDGGPLFTTQYPSAGTYPITVTVSNGPNGIYTATDGVDMLVEPPPPFAPLRINAGGLTPYADSQGQIWEADQYYVNGFTYSRSVAIDGTEDDPLFQTERYATLLGYDIPTNGIAGCFTTDLHFAEIYFGAGNPGGGGTGSRSFNVLLEGQTIAGAFDIHLAAGGPNTAVSLFHYVLVSDGTLDLDLSTVVNNAKLSAVEINYFGPVCPSPTTITFDSVTTRADVVAEWLAWLARSLVALTILTLLVVVIRRRPEAA